MVRRVGTIAGLAVAALSLPTGAAATSDPGSTVVNRYSLAGGCYALRSQAVGRLVEKRDGAYRVSAKRATRAEGFRMQATTLGEYLFFGQDRDFLAIGSVPLLGDRVEPAGDASGSANWRVEKARRGAFTISSPAAGKVLAASRASGELVLVDRESAGRTARFSFERARGCPRYPEVEVNARGKPPRGETSYGQVKGLIDAHMHMMAFEFLGGNVHCGRPWHRFGAPHALVDCPDHYPNGCAAVVENIASYGNPAHCHDPVGWPTFKDWPHHASLTHEQSYYRWLERAWRGGLRVFVNLFVENHAGCVIFPPPPRNSCNEMDSVRLQAKDIYELQDYIDAQSGGPGKGWFRIVTNPFQARRVINRGKLAVVLGIEISQPFDCTVRNEQPGCDRAMIDRQLAEIHRLGVRDMELINKFDNALAGVAMDAGATGAITGAGNFFETGKWWQIQTCEGAAHDQEQITAHNEDNLLANVIEAYMPPGAAPLYPEPPHCNTRGLSALGEYAVRQLMKRGMMIDPDHLDVISRRQVLDLLEAKRYPGVVSSHSWSTPDAYPRIYRLGGFITPYAGSSMGFVEQWRALRPERSKRFYYGFGYGADMNGFGAQGGPREDAENPVRYPFKSFDGEVTLRRQRSGERVFDINEDGVAHYGLYPDWVEDLRRIAGERIIRDMSRGPEAYLQMWERAVGVPATRCQPRRGRFTAEGLGRVRLGFTPERLLRRAGQPTRRPMRAYRYCVRGSKGGGGKVVAVFTPRGKVGLVVSTARGHRAGGISPGDPAGPLGSDPRFVSGMRDGEVSYVGVASSPIADSPERLQRCLRLAGIR